MIALDFDGINTAPHWNKGRIPWNKGKTKASDSRVAKMGRTQSKLRRERGIAAGSQNPYWNKDGLVFDGERAKVRIITGWLSRALAVWIQYNGPIPFPGTGRQKDQFLIHHKDEDKLNDTIENLELLTNSAHSRHHWSIAWAKPTKLHCETCRCH